MSRPKITARRCPRPEAHEAHAWTGVVRIDAAGPGATADEYVCDGKGTDACTCLIACPTTEEATAEVEDLLCEARRTRDSHAILIRVAQLTGPHAWRSEVDE